MGMKLHQQQQQRHEAWCIPLRVKASQFVTTSANHVSHVCHYPHSQCVVLRERLVLRRARARFSFIKISNSPQLLIFQFAPSKGLKDYTHTIALTRLLGGLTTFVIELKDVISLRVLVLFGLVGLCLLTSWCCCSSFAWMLSLFSV